MPSKYYITSSFDTYLDTRHSLVHSLTSFSFLTFFLFRSFSYFFLILSFVYFRLINVFYSLISLVATIFSINKRILFTNFAGRDNILSELIRIVIKEAIKLYLVRRLIRLKNLNKYQPKIIKPKNTFE